MPTPRVHASNADRQRAYRERQAQARIQEQQAKGIPPRPAIPTLPGDRRWNGLIDQASSLLETARDEMQEYHDDRSEVWQEGERGEALQERIDALEAILSDLENLPG